MVAKVLGKTEKVKYIVYDHTERTDKNLLNNIGKILDDRGGRLVTFEELREMGENKILTKEEFGPGPKEDDTFCIMYTSGSTGTPKGVTLTHRNVICSSEFD